jgi:hypothetical protein
MSNEDKKIKKELIELIRSWLEKQQTINIEEMRDLRSVEEEPAFKELVEKLDLERVNDGD